MASPSPLDKRLEGIQQALKLRPDALIGPVTVTRLENQLGVVPKSGTDFSLEVSKRGIDEIVKFEVTSESVYTRKYAAPIWPGGDSGVTVGIGYDLGTENASRIASDWSAHASEADLSRLQSAARIQGTPARSLATKLANQGVRIPLAAAKEVFLTSSLPRFAASTRKIYPGVEQLPADAQAMLLSLVYNRGAALGGDRRREMKEIVTLVRRGDLAGIAQQLRSMKRLWDPAKLPGLIARRDREAELVEGASRVYSPDELIRV